MILEVLTIADVMLSCRCSPRPHSGLTNDLLTTGQQTPGLPSPRQPIRGQSGQIWPIRGRNHPRARHPASHPQPQPAQSQLRISSPCWNVGMSNGVGKQYRFTLIEHWLMIAKIHSLVWSPDYDRIYWDSGVCTGTVSPYSTVSSLNLRHQCSRQQTLYSLDCEKSFKF